MSELISAEALVEILDDPALRIADTRWYRGEPRRGHAAYHAGHIPGAVFVDLDLHLSARTGPGRHPMPDREVFATTLGGRGFGDDHVIVAYDDREGAIAARLWWMLRDIGHTSIRVLDGGLTAWTSAGLPAETECPAPGPAPLTVRPGVTRSLDRDDLRARLGRITLADARAPERYRGDEEPIDPIAGHIPTAINLPTSDHLTPDGRFRDPADLRKHYEAAFDGDTIFYCGSGVTACHDILAAVEAGAPEPILYPGSWSDWSASGMPVATGPEPGAI